MSKVKSSTDTSLDANKDYTNKDYHEEMRAIGLNIAYFRKLKGLTQIQLAEKLDISRTHMSNIEATNVDTSVSLLLLFKIADCLDIDIVKLFEKH
ncbi:MAG: helix-turn-helix transcriptional regulator [Lachnospiraceae bacterium]|nr:helix-turn-helix transcriptional regulator [Lachnospiraceae bacterium]